VVFGSCAFPLLLPTNKYTDVLLVSAWAVTGLSLEDEVITDPINPVFDTELEPATVKGKPPIPELVKLVLTEKIILTMQIFPIFVYSPVCALNAPVPSPLVVTVKVPSS
jgi:hypothetical protein